MSSRSLLVVSFVLSSSFALLGCDPMAPGVNGQVALGKPVEVIGFQNIEMRAIVADGDFDASAPVFPDKIADLVSIEGGDSGLRTGTISGTQDQGIVFYQGDMPAKGVTFPLPYEVGGEGIGYTSEERWRLFVWLSESADSHLEKRPASGAPYGVVDFDAEGCGMMGGYCSFKTGVTVIIDQTAP